MSKIVMNRSNIERLLIEKVKELLHVEEFNTLFKDIDMEGASSIYLESADGEYIALCRQDNSSRTLYIKAFNASAQWMQDVDTKEQQLLQNALAYNENSVIRDQEKIQQCNDAKNLVKRWARDYAVHNDLAIKKFIGPSGEATIENLFATKLEELFIVTIGLADDTSVVVKLEIQNQKAQLSAYKEVGQWNMEGRLM